MNCPNCGFENESNAHFCRHCGMPLADAPQPQYAPSQPVSVYAQPLQPPPQPAYAPPPQPPPGVYAQVPKKKSKAGLIIGICAGALVLAGAVLALIFLLPSGPSAEGYWVAEEEGIVLSLDKDSELTMYSLAGAAGADYDYDKAKNEGSFKAGGVRYEFTVDGDKLKLTNADTDETLRFDRAAGEPDIEGIVTAPMLGLWMNDDNGEVLELKSGGKANSYSPNGEFQASFEFDVESGEGVFRVVGNEFVITCDGQTLIVEGIGPYQKVPGDFDITAFVLEHGNPLPGMWYDIAGQCGTLEFFVDGTCVLTTYGVSVSGTYTFDNVSGKGEIMIPSGSGTLTLYTDGTLELDGVYFTQQYVEQQAAEDIYTALSGTWYESGGTGTFSFYDDGTFYLYYGDTLYWGNFLFNPINLTGSITTDTNETFDFYVTGDSLYLGDILFTRDYAETAPVAEGMWYDSAGVAGTLGFYPDGTVEIYSYGETVVGTYTFDATTGSGYMSFAYEGETYGATFYVWADTLTLDDGTVYTRGYVEQQN